MRENKTVVVHDLLLAICLLGLGDQWLDEGAQCFGFGQCSYDTLVRDQLAGHVAQEGFAMGFLSAQVVDFVSVTHDCLF
jgi:hypothetical protein